MTHDLHITAASVTIIDRSGVRVPVGSLSSVIRVLADRKHKRPPVITVASAHTAEPTTVFQTGKWTLTEGTFQALPRENAHRRYILEICRLHRLHPRPRRGTHEIFHTGSRPHRRPQVRGHHRLSHRPRFRSSRLHINGHIAPRRADDQRGSCRRGMMLPRRQWFSSRRSPTSLRLHPKTPPPQPSTFCRRVHDAPALGLRAECR